uniref:Movement protein TGB2 n=1 Tax=Potato virus H TaxID=1046402 RepID=A0A346CP44_9VIRU|nr:triple-gene-block protein 2 [Potato virus H]
MPLSPPPNYTGVFVCACIGLSIALVVHLATRSTIPQVGDNIHSLPHGGLYRDGTKQITYCSPKKLNSIEGKLVGLPNPWLIVVGLIAGILGINWVESKRCARCSSFHA